MEDIEQYGCHIINVSGDHHVPGWSYTIGLFETMHQPEIVITGLNPDTAANLLNEVCRRIQEGIRFRASDRATELLEAVECEFREVDKPWLKHILCFADWFYNRGDFPVLQCVYPDLENRFPWDEGFDSDWIAKQPLLFSDSPFPDVGRHFWSANDPDSSLFNWRFDDPPHTRSYTTKRIANGEEPVLYVSHEDDGDWQFHGASESRLESATIACLHHFVDADPTIGELADLPLGWRAWRDHVGGDWRREPKPPSEDDE